MSEDYGPTFITVTDEDGEEIELEFIDAVDLDGTTYMAFFPAMTEDDDPEDVELVVMKVLHENGEELLSTPDSDEEYTQVYEIFMERILEMDEDDEA